MAMPSASEPPAAHGDATDRWDETDHGLETEHARATEPMVTAQAAPVPPPRSPATWRWMAAGIAIVAAAVAFRRCPGVC
ncbi:MAG: hypothetical protein H0U82_10050 [Actinobacteria bacterium]|nr:hypothetical protein [Actinomycetota bacterium]